MNSIYFSLFTLMQAERLLAIFEYQSILQVEVTSCVAVFIRYLHSFCCSNFAHCETTASTMDIILVMHNIFPSKSWITLIKFLFNVIRAKMFPKDAYYRTVCTKKPFQWSFQQQTEQLLDNQFWSSSHFLTEQFPYKLVHQYIGGKNTVTTVKECSDFLSHKNTIFIMSMSNQNGLILKRNKAT